MKRSKFSEAQIAFILRQGEEGTAVGEICRKAGISEATYYNWRKKYGGLMPSEMKRLRQLEEENGKLKKIVVDLSLDKEMLQDLSGRQTGGSCSGDLASKHSTCLRCVASPPIDLPLPLTSGRAGSSE